MTSPPQWPDPSPDLIGEAQRGDREALRSLLAQISPPVRQWALAHTGDPDSAADLSQEVFLLLLRKIGSYRGDSRFLTWLFSVTRNQALEELRRRKRREKKMNRLKVEMEAGPKYSSQRPGNVDRQRLRGLLGVFVDELPPRQREVFQLSEMQGLTSPEIGEILDLAPASVRAALLKARRSLRKKMLEHHPEFVQEYVS
ncbi:MAG: RNA polymerase sigma factor [Gemmatimonadota bacterium]